MSGGPFSFRIARSRTRGAGAASAAVAEPAEVDDAPDALVGAFGEAAGRAPLALHEVAAVAAAHRVDQVVGDVDAAADARERVALEYVALLQLGAAPSSSAGR